ncbi:phage tail spike protein [Collinsella stercoris]|uniref:Phage minor structural protein, N-terminal domain protein n=1 Tax=Collinsella stercoris DSM 13279 TaxID=445975 RepID=B6GDH3_9ACTN|nr:phage tail spike protein [Collinsella stercoris]EEA89612.1 phage minor structural protein, N-terminal domain protein [Collinsella stercoris DSM 13279]UEA45208.1 phage tail protein [Collinsella stercoris DSM 13279]UWP12267.1 phage tail protein [Collinsella stercoris]
MALIRRIGFTRFSRWGDNLGRLTVSAATHTDALDGTDELNITCAEDLVKGDRVVWIDLQGVCHEHIVDTIDRVHDDDGAPETQATCINSINETWDDWLDDKRPSGSVSVALTSILADTRWEVGTCDQGGTASRTLYHISVREGIAELLETWGGELETTIVHNGAGIVARRVNIRALRGNQSSAKRFTWTKDLVSVKRSMASDNPKTRVYGYGKGVKTEGGGYGRRLTFGDINGGKDYVEDAEATEIWGHPDGEGGILPAVASYVNEQCEDAAQLLQETKDYLKQVKEPKVTYTASVIDLYAFGRSWEGVGVGDDVAIIDKGFSEEGVRLHGRVSQIERDLLTGDATVTFGTLTDTMADMWQSVSNALKGNSQQNALYDAAAGTSVSWLQQLQAALNAQFNAVGTYRVETFELGTIYSNVPIDALNGLPLRNTSGMWAVNLNGMGLRLASGLTSDGQWDWKTFLTGGMVTADLINAGTMRADRVRAGLLTDEKGKNFWDLTTGEFSLSATATVGGDTVQSIADTAASGAQQNAVKAAEEADAKRLEEAKKYAAEQASSAGTDAKDQAKKYVDALDEALGQKSIFDRLTNNGETQGVYLKDGKVYINATYMDTGVLDADLLKAGIITDKAGKNFWDLTTGEFSLSADASVGDGDVGSSVVAVDVQYGNSTSSSTVPTTWTTYANWKQGQYLWTRLKLTLADGNTEYTTAHRMADNDGIGVSQVCEQYYLSTSSTAQTGGNWYYYQPTWVSGRYYWTRSEITWSDGTKTYTTPVLARALTSGNQSTDDLDEDLDQREVFNRLTNNGQTQGIYLSGGLLYINASYIETGIISDRIGRNTWNLSTGKLTTNYMTANNIRANGTFECGSASNLLRLINGEIRGLENGTQIGCIDFSAHSYNIDNPSIKYRGIQMTAEGTVRISSPQISTAASSNESTTATICHTGNHRLHYVSEIHDNGNGTVGWTNSWRSINFINGLCTTCSFD